MNGQIRRGDLGNVAADDRYTVAVAGRVRMLRSVHEEIVTCRSDKDDDEQNNDRRKEFGMLFRRFFCGARSPFPGSFCHKSPQ